CGSISLGLRRTTRTGRQRSWRRRRRRSGTPASGATGSAATSRGTSRTGSAFRSHPVVTRRCRFGSGSSRSPTARVGTSTSCTSTCRPGDGCLVVGVRLGGLALEGEADERCPYPSAEPLRGGEGEPNPLARRHPQAGGRVEGAEGDLVAAAHRRVAVCGLPHLVVVVHNEEPALHADEERAALLAFVLLASPAALLQAVPDRVDERGRHEALEAALRRRRRECVVDELTHPERCGEAEEVRAVAEHFGVRADGQLQATHPGAVATDVDSVVVYEPYDRGHDGSPPSGRTEPSGPLVGVEPVLLVRSGRCGDRLASHSRLVQCRFRSWPSGIFPLQIWLFRH